MKSYWNLAILYNTKIQLIDRPEIYQELPQNQSDLNCRKNIQQKLNQICVKIRMASAQIDTPLGKFLPLDVYLKVLKPKPSSCPLIYRLFASFGLYPSRKGEGHSTSLRDPPGDSRCQYGALSKQAFKSPLI